MQIFQSFSLEYSLNTYKGLKNSIVKNNMTNYKFNAGK